MRQAKGRIYKRVYHHGLINKVLNMSEEKRKNLKDVMEELDKYFEDFEKDLQNAIRESISLAKVQKEPFVAGFSFKLGPEGRPSIQLFGDRPMDEGYRSPMS